MASNPLKKLAGDTLIYGMGTIVPRLLNYLLVPVYTIWVFTPEQYGKVTELYAFVAILLVLLTYGMEISFFRYANEYKNDVKSVFSTATTSLLITSTVFLIVVFFNKLSIARFIKYSGHPEFIVMIALIVGLDAISTIPFAYLRYRNKARRFSTIKIVNVIIAITFNIILLIVIPRTYPNTYQHFWLYRITPLVGMVFLANVLASFSTILLLLPEMRYFKLSIDKVLLKKLLTYGLPILVIGLAGMINEVSDKILLRYYLPHNLNAEAIIGIYGANYKLAILMMLFIQMFRYAAEPFFFAEYEKSDAKTTYSRVMTAFVGFTWFIFLLVMLFIDGFKQFIGPAFWVGLQIVPIVLMAKLFLGVFYNLSVWYKLTDKTIYGGLVAVFGATVTIVLNIILIPKYGYVGSAWANFFCYFSMMMISYLWGRKIFLVHYEMKKIGLFTVIALLFYFLSTRLQGLSTKEHMLTGAGMLLVYSVVVWIAIRKYVITRNVPGTPSL
ncbi:MAG: oligosaccharide flippase family protein [Bacteroidales bacterium]|nr:oligosaccharide flippase family protein [Bacteroidales bacterium]